VSEVKEAAASTDGQGGWRQLGSKGTVSWSLRAASPGVKANRLVRGTLTRAPPRLVLELFMDVGAAKSLEPGIKHCYEVVRALCTTTRRKLAHARRPNWTRTRRCSTT